MINGKNYLYIVNDMCLEKTDPLVSESICIIPYYGGPNVANAGHSRVDQRAEYLEKTIESAEKYFQDIYVTASNKNDFKTICGLNVNIKPYLIKNIVSPAFLPCFSLMVFQDLIKKGHVSADYVFYTEADQIVEFENMQTDLRLLNETTYISPIRIEKVYGEGVPGRGVPVVHKNEKYVAYAVYGENGYEIYKRLKGRKLQSGYYRTTDPIEAYGAAWLCTRELFLKIPFNVILEGSPLESPSYDIALVSDSLKAQRWQRCFVEHLSGYEYQRRWANNA